MAFLKKRIVLAIGYPWFEDWDSSLGGYTKVVLMNKANRQVGRQRVPFKPWDSGAFQKYRLVLERMNR